MIGRLVTAIIRGGLRLAGVRVLERKLGSCGGCYCGVWQSDERVRIDGEWFHLGCAKSVRRGSA